MSDDFILNRKNTKKEDLGWALTLADMMMLLLCFFVMLIAIADIDESKYENVSDSLATAMGVKVPPKGIVEVKTEEGAPVVRRTISNEQRNLFQMQLEMARLVGREADALKIKLRADSVAIVLKGDVFFGLGKADLTGRAKSVLARIAPALAKSPYDVVVEGHSDNIPMFSKQFPSNWELSSARASAVARYLLANGFNKNRIKVLGMADTSPMWPNIDVKGNPIPDNQKRNRRVVLLVFPPKVGSVK